ncbi:MAG: ZIP family metal transporter [Candidatus Aenigmarchaeota archaeon]|nr:ZIP family metal transporter [Candidatus Aenigmarchaeota archaeon]
MVAIWTYVLLSVFLVSAVSFVGISALAFNQRTMKRALFYMVSFSAGALFGDAFIHLLPEAIAASGFTLEVSLYIITGIVVSFVIEKVMHWNHMHRPGTEEKIEPFALMNLFGDAVHNSIDGLIIGASYLVSVPVGIATTLAVVFHEIPQEISDFGVLVYGGFTKWKALFFNFLVALTAIAGAAAALLLGNYVSGVTAFLVPFAAGNFIYIAGSNLIPELQKEVRPIKSLKQTITLLLGIFVMLAIALLE